LDVVEEHKSVDLVDEIEEAAPRQVAWLDDTDCPHVRAVADPERGSPMPCSGPVHSSGAAARNRRTYHDLNYYIVAKRDV
jgi:hypothetical protein